MPTYTTVYNLLYLGTQFLCIQISKDSFILHVTYYFNMFVS